MSTSRRILIVDDEEMNRDILVEMVESLDHATETAEDGIGALAMLKLDFDLILLDVNMPGMDGFEVARRIRKDANFGSVPIIMVTGQTSREDRILAVEVGVNDFIAKPVDYMELRVRLESQLKIKEQQDAILLHKAELETLVKTRTEALRETLIEMAEAQRETHEAYLETIRRLAIAAEFKDTDTGAHIERVGRLCAMLGRALNLPPGEIEILRHASPMHDVGKMGIPDHILLKPGKLDDEEWEVMKQHTMIGARILGGSDSELLKAGELIARTHHEWWNGSGYPNGLAGEDIPLMGRICAMVDVFDAVTSERPYKPAFPNEEAVRILEEKKGNHLEPDLVDLFLESLDEVQAIQTESVEPAESSPVT
jgi:putative two-component system response regulator